MLTEKLECLLEYWKTGIMEYLNANWNAYWNIGILEYWNTVIMECVLEYWNTYWNAYWNTGMLTGIHKNLLEY